jgi:2-desacetyl-2-hydroxyethyl bacteriochlorophyllide A dehydrogenase
VRLEEGPKPIPGCGEALIRVRACGICGSDMHVYHAPKEYIKTPWVAGHEAAGEIVELGPDADGFAVDDRVAVEPTIADETSPLTWIGRYELSDLRHIGSPAHPGGFAEYLVAPVTNLHKIPEALSFKEAALAEVYAVSAHALTLFPVSPGDTVLVIGSGPVGLTVAELARLSGAEPLIVIGKPDVQLTAVSQALGAKTIHADTSDLKDAVQAATDGRGADLVFEAVGGSAPTLQQAVDFAALAGRVCIIGGYTKPCELSTGPARMKELTIGWSFCYGRRGYRKEFDIVLDLLAAGRLDAYPWITHSFALSEIVEAFSVTADRRSGSIKVMVEP